MSEVNNTNKDKIKVNNAVIMAAGTSSRFAPLSYEKPKGLITVKGEVLIERQIKQLKSAGIDSIYIVTGYKAEDFDYLRSKYRVKTFYNPYYDTRNNNASIKAVEDVLSNTYVCSADNYFNSNPFEPYVDSAYYAAVYSDGPTDEWCLEIDDRGFITNVTVGGSDAWYMLGHTFWDDKFSSAFRRILDAEYDDPTTADKLWESIYMEHLDDLHMKIRKYPKDFIFEFDTLDELRGFDKSYVTDTRSVILKAVGKELGVEEKDLTHIKRLKDPNSTEAIGFTFDACGVHHTYLYDGGLRD